ncbi:GatB/YqeY domain-containing protein [Sphingobium lignivorans]|uniref:GatB/YqeY domain-containing protein n=1 Tax=Sphingobium lignivorans TaxID=2735886 RepID=A0ABR6NKH0_9SPHN|nr:GatB/YqeY domain-containing protein [Sphingobium lignivorans]MBB5987761.1 hypothetical protein [Sphingobium lignivorans]
MGADAAAAMQARLRADLKQAMQSRATLDTRVIRALIAAIDNAQAITIDLDGAASAMRAFGDSSGEVPRRPLSAEDLRALLMREAGEREAAALDLKDLGRPEDANRLLAEAAIVRRYAALPG